jgi:hypothetical protein
MAFAQNAPLGFILIITNAKEILKMDVLSSMDLTAKLAEKDSFWLKTSVSESFWDAKNMTLWAHAKNALTISQSLKIANLPSNCSTVFVSRTKSERNKLSIMSPNAK